MTDLGKCITLGLIAVVLLYLAENAKEWPGFTRGLIGIVGGAFLIGALFYFVSWIVDLGTVMFERVQRAKAITPAVALAREIAPLTPVQVDYLRQHGQLSIMAYFDMKVIKYVLRCVDGHEIPLYDPDGNDLQTLLADMSHYHPELKPLREYGNDSIMQRHARSFALTVARAGMAEIWGPNRAAKWNPGWSAAALLDEVTKGGIIGEQGTPRLPVMATETAQI